MKKLKVEDFKHGGFNSLLKKAQDLGVELSFVEGTEDVIRFRHDGKSVYAKKNVVPAKRVQAKLSRDKDITKFVLSDLGISVPKGILASSFKEAKKLIKKNRLKYPLIAKPSDGSRAVGVTWNIRNDKDLKGAIDLINKKKETRKDFLVSKKFIVEEMFEGDELRVLVFNGKAVSCVHKIPATVVGDGKSSIKQLVEEFNKKRDKGFEIKIDKVVKDTFIERGISEKTVLPKGEELRLRRNVNMSDGGRSVECTDKMHKYFKDISVKAVEALGLFYGGLDIFVKDMSSKTSEYAILEVNPNPYYNMHEKPLIEGKGIDFSYMFLRTLFPGLKNNK